MRPLTFTEKSTEIISPVQARSHTSTNSLHPNTLVHPINEHKNRQHGYKIQKKQEQ